MFGIAAFAQSTLAGLGGNNRIQYAKNGTYSYVGKPISIIETRYLLADNGAYSYVGSDSIINHHRNILGASGSYTYVGINSTSSLFIGDWELECASPDVWTCQDTEAVTWVVETVAPITWN